MLALQVLHKFLKVFGEFDWDHYCLSLQGPIPLSSFPEWKGKLPLPPQLDKTLLLCGQLA